MNPQHRRMALWSLLGAVAAFGLAYASVPLYKAFCEATGFGGTTMRAKAAPKSIPSAAAKQSMMVHFDVNTHDTAWAFSVRKPSLSVGFGKTAVMEFTVKNLSDKPAIGRATYNVLPESMGPYFMKIECFCFTDQSFTPGESKTFPVVFYIDPKMMEDIDSQSVRDVTLSYTFFSEKAPVS